MTTKTEEDFESELKECLDIARSLQNVPSEDTKRFVTDQLLELQNFLQQKQLDAEKRLRETMQEEEKEIQDLKARIDRASAGDDSATEVEQKDMLEVWRELKENEWADIVRCLQEEQKGKFSFPNTIESLIKFLKETYEIVQTRYNTSLHDMCFQVKYPGGDKRNKDLVLKDSDLRELLNVCKKCQVKAMPYCMGSIKTAILHDKQLKNQIEKAKTKQHQAHLKKYLEKCIEFCWLAAIEEPAIKIVVDPFRECRDIKDLFDGVTKVRKECEVEWPAIVQGDSVVCQWQLYNKRQPNQVKRKVGFKNDVRVVDPDEPDETYIPSKSFTNRIQHGEGSDENKPRQHKAKEAGDNNAPLQYEPKAKAHQKHPNLDSW